MGRKQLYHYSQGFTLIELLIVIAIIAVLAAIAFPGFGYAREEGRKTTCLSNLSQLGHAIEMYSSDYDGVYPYGLDGLEFHFNPLKDIFIEPYLSQASKMGEVRQILMPYIREEDIFHCPSEHIFYPDGNPELKVDFSYKTLGMSYIYFPYPAMKHQGQDYYAKPAESCLMGDIVEWHGGNTPLVDGRLNELFGDYHVKNVTYVSFLNSIHQPEDSR